MESPLVASKAGLAVGLCSGVLAIAFEAMSVSTAMPEAAADLGRVDLYAWIFSLFTVGMLFATVVGGRLGDRRGPVVPLVIGLVLFSVGLMVAGFAPAMEVLLVGRLLQGLGSGSLNVGYALVLAHGFDPAERPRMLSWFSTAWVVPSLLGPPLAAFITRALSWHWVFFSVVPLLVLTVVVGGPALAKLPRASLRGEHAPGASVPLWTALVAALGTVGLQWVGQVLAHRDSTVETGVIVVVVVLALAGLVVAVPRLMPARDAAGGRGGLLAPIIVRTLGAGSFFGAQSFFPLLMVQLYGWSLLAAGAMLTVGAVGWTTGAWLQSQSRVPLRRDQVLLAGIVCVAIGLAVLVAVPWSGQWWLALVGWVFAGLGMGSSMASITLVVILRSSQDQQGRNNAALQVGEAMGNSILIGLAGTIYAFLAPVSLSSAFGWLLAAMAACSVVAVIAAARIGAIRDRD